MLEKIVIIIFVICFVVSLIVIGNLVKHLMRNNHEQKLDSMKEIGILTSKIEQMHLDVKNEINDVINNRIYDLLKENSQISENNNMKLERFQTAIQEMINTRFDSLSMQMNQKINNINDTVNSRIELGFKNTTDTMLQVRERLQVIDYAQKNIELLSKDVISLKNILAGNQTRGAYGEYQLSMILNSVFGGATHCYAEQYTLKNNAIDGTSVRADAVIFMPEPNQMICIDSKFPFADYKRMFETRDELAIANDKKRFKDAVKKHIKDIAEKYIILGQTADEAIMFIPSDGIFTFIHTELEDVINFAREKKVILTSPSTLRPILVTINMIKIEVERSKNLKIISEQLMKLGKDFVKFGDEWDKFANSIESLVKKKEQFDKRVNSINNRFVQISSSSLEEDN